MSVLGDEEAFESQESALDNPLDNEEAISGLMKNLLNSQGLNKAWMMFGKRLKAAERGLNKALTDLAKMPEEYIPRPECTATTTQQGMVLDEHGVRLDTLDRLVDQVSQTVNKDHRQELDEIQKRLTQIEDRSSQLGAQCEAVDKRGQESLQNSMQAVEDLRTEIGKHMAGGIVNRPQLEKELANSESSLVQQIRDLEKKLLANTEHEIEKSLEQLVSIQGTGVNTNVSTHQQNMLSLISLKLVDPVQTKIGNIMGRLGDLVSDLSKQREDAHTQHKRLEKLGMDAQTKIKMSAGELREEINARAKQGDVNDKEEALKKQIAGISSAQDKFHERVLKKLSEFVDHFVKIHEIVDDHEHCIRHHAEELENRGTKYDLLVCRSHIDKCASKDDMAREVTEIKKALTWQSSKLESVGLANQGASSRDSRRPSRGPSPQIQEIGPPSRAGKKLKRNDRRTTRSNTSSSKEAGYWASERSVASEDESASSPSPSPAPQERGTKTPRPAHAASGASGHTEHRPKLQQGVASAMQIASPNKKEDELVQPTTDPGNKQSVHDHVPLNQPQDTADAETDESGLGEREEVSAMLRQQVEVCAMGLVSLAHLTLREGKTNEARKNRAQQETPLLEELLTLRRWITSRTAPQGWTSERIASIALSFSMEDSRKANRYSPSRHAMTSSTSQDDLHRAQLPAKAIVDPRPGMSQARQWAQILGGGGAATGGRAPLGPSSARGLRIAEHLPPLRLGEHT